MTILVTSLTIAALAVAWVAYGTWRAARIRARRRAELEAQARLKPWNVARRDSYRGITR